MNYNIRMVTSHKNCLVFVIKCRFACFMLCTRYNIMELCTFDSIETKYYRCVLFICNEWSDRMVDNQFTVCKIKSYTLSFTNFYGTLIRFTYNKGVKFRASRNKRFDVTILTIARHCLSNHLTIYRLVGHNRPKNYHLRICCDVSASIKFLLWLLLIYHIFYF